MSRDASCEQPLMHPCNSQPPAYENCRKYLLCICYICRELYAYYAHVSRVAAAFIHDCTRDNDVALPFFSLSVRPSVCPFATRCGCLKIAKYVVEILPPSVSGHTFYLFLGELLITGEYKRSRFSTCKSLSLENGAGIVTVYEYWESVRYRTTCFRLQVP